MERPLIVWFLGQPRQRAGRGLDFTKRRSSLDAQPLKPSSSGAGLAVILGLGQEPAEREGILEADPLDLTHQLSHSPEESMRTCQHLLEDPKGKPRRSIDT